MRPLRQCKHVERVKCSTKIQYSMLSDLEREAGSMWRQSCSLPSMQSRQSWNMMRSALIFGQACLSILQMFCQFEWCQMP